MSTLLRNRSTKRSIKFMDIPNEEHVTYFKAWLRRSQLDSSFMRNSFQIDSIVDKNSVFKRYEPKGDDCDVLQIDPSYSRFKIPYEMVCKIRYNEDKKRYDEQFHSEIQQLVDSQTSAIEASYMVRVMAYTTLWPPYHNRRELQRTSEKFYQLNKKERKRLRKIMAENI